MDQLKTQALEFLSGLLAGGLPWVKMALPYIAYSALEYWFGKTDKVKAGSFPEFLWNGVKAVLFPQIKSQESNSGEPKN